MQKGFSNQDSFSNQQELKLFKKSRNIFYNFMLLCISKTFGIRKRYLTMRKSAYKFYKTVVSENPLSLNILMLKKDQEGCV